MLANRLKILLAERDLSIKDVTDEIKLSRNSLSNMINNPFANISTENIDTLCNYLNVSPSDFFDFSPWKLKFGFSNRSRKLKYREEPFEVANYFISAISGKTEITSAFSVELTTNAEKSLTFRLDILGPVSGNFTAIYTSLSPFFKHFVINNILEDIPALMKLIDENYFLSGRFLSFKTANIEIYTNSFGLSDDSLVSNSVKLGSIKYDLN